jgi:hypothetical protein
MKNHLLTLILCLGCLNSLMAQNVWKPIEMEGQFLGVSADGSIFSNWGYSGLHRSQDEGATWELNYDLSYVSSSHFVINDNNRIFIFNDNSHKLCYSDDNGDTWQEQASCISTNWVEGMYSLSNDTIVMVNNQKFFWTLDGGESWNETNICFLQDMVFTDILADHAGNVYISITNAVPIYELGIYTANFNDIDNWTWLIEGAFINHMELDPEGNVVAGGYGQYQQQPDLYLVPDWRFTVADNGIVYDLHNVATNDNYAVLRYSADHGETFYEYGEALPLYSPAPGGMGDGSIYKGRDGHLYFGGHGARMKSVFNTNDIHYIEGEVVVLPYAFAFGNYPYGAGQAIRVDDDHIYPVTVDGFRPDPTDLSRLIVRYDTIPMGATIGAFGTIKEMHDYVGDSQNVLDIQQTTAHYYDAITATLEEHWNDNKVIITNKKSQTYYITINGEKQDFPLVFNGDTLYWGCLPRTFIGHCGIQTDQYANHFYGMELVDIQPFMNYNYQLEDGTLTTDYWDPPCLSCPCEENENQHFLTFLVGDFTFPSPFYLMRNGQLYKNTFINNNIFREGMHVDIKGIHHLRYDMPGETVHTIELVEMDTDEEVTLTGTIVDAPMPHTGYIPLPGMEFAFMANGTRYYLENEQDYDWILVGNDTIYLGQEITATFTTKMMLDFNQNFYYRINITAAEPYVEIFPRGTEWYYEIKHVTGDVTYQHLEYVADTAINSRRAKIIVETNTMYDKTEWINHEYIYEDGDKIYWWNKETEEFTLLYDFGADVGDEWVIDGGWYTITVHVDAAHTVTYKSETYRVLSVSDPSHLFTGDIICGIGHTKSFFPETPMAKDYEVDGLRCFWQDGELILNTGEEDCDAIYNTIHTEVDENTDAAFTIYPNPTNGILFVGMHRVRPTDRTHSMCPYRITNILGQTVKSGYITSDNQQIDVRDLNQGFYFITIGETTQKIIINP